MPDTDSYARSEISFIKTAFTGLATRVSSLEDRLAKLRDAFSPEGVAKEFAPLMQPLVADFKTKVDVALKPYDTALKTLGAKLDRASDFLEEMAGKIRKLERFEQSINEAIGGVDLFAYADERDRVHRWWDTYHARLACEDPKGFHDFVHGRCEAYADSVHGPLVKS